MAVPHGGQALHEDGGGEEEAGEPGRVEKLAGKLRGTNKKKEREAEKLPMGVRSARA